MNKPKSRQKTSPLSFMFVLTFTASVAVTGVFGLYPNNSITQQYRTVLAHNIAPEFLAPVNGFLGVLNVAPIPEDLYQPGDGVVLDPGGWLLEQLGMTVPPLYGPDSTVVVFDPAGALLELFGVDVAALPESTAPLDPATLIFQQIGLALPPESPNENPPDPAGTLLAFLFPDYDPESATESPLDPGGILLAWLIPGYQPPLINGSQNPPPDPGGQLLALLVSPQLFDTTNNPLNPGDVILSWLFPPASEAPLPSEQDVIDAAMTSIVATQPNLASLATNTPTPTLTLMPGNALTFTPTYTLTPTGTVSPVIINPTTANNPAPNPTITPSPTDTLTPFLGFNVNAVDVNGAGAYVIVSPGALVNVSYSFDVYDDPCPGCVTQLVTGLGTPGSHAGTCAFDGDAGLSTAPATGVEDVILTAPMTSGIYSVVVEYYWEFGCTNALALYGIGLGQQAPSQTIAQVEVAPINGVVQSAADDGTAVPGNCPGAGCRLRDAIAAALPGDTITFASSLSGQTITITGGELVIAKNLTIDGSTLATTVTVSGGGVSRVFNITGAYNVTLRKLNISNGSATQGGGIYNSGTLTVTACTFSGNSASVDGGGIFNNGYSPNIAVLNVTNSTFSGNSAVYGGGGIAQIAAGGSVTLSVTNSTFVDNSANYGGGIHNDSGTVTVTNSTFSGNQANIYAGGIENYSSASTLNIVNTIIANSTGAAGDCYNNGGTIGINANNLVEDGSCSASLSGDPLLDSLAYNGGVTMNMALLAGSPAIDAGDDSYCPSTDQRGATRPQGLHCDIGAVETQ